MTVEPQGSKAERLDWLSRQRAECMACGYSLKMFGELRRLQVHHIERRSHARRRFDVVCNLLVLCEPCHRDFDSQGEWPHAKQLALKLLRDPASYNLAAWLEIRQPDREDREIRVTQDEVDEWVRKLRETR